MFCKLILRTFCDQIISISAKYCALMHRTQDNDNIFLHHHVIPVHVIKYMPVSSSCQLGGTPISCTCMFNKCQAIRGTFEN